MDRLSPITQLEKEKEKENFFINYKRRRRIRSQIDPLGISLANSIKSYIA